MKRSPLITDLSIAVIAAILILVLTPGVAVAGMIALLVLLTCAVSVIFDSRRRRRGQAPPRRRPARTPQQQPRNRVPSAGG